MISKLFKNKTASVKGVVLPRRLRQWLVRYSSKFEILSSVIAILSGWLGREAKSVLTGRLDHMAQRKSPHEDSIDGALYTLRRNIHRIEKGIIMRPRRPIFALKYIQLTVDVYETVVMSETNDDESIQWAFDVLTEYFSIVSSHSVPDKARKKFESVESRNQTSDSKKVPYNRPTESLNITIEDLTKLAIRRRSCRWFLQTPVPREKIDKAIEVAGYAPSACNRQPFEFRIYDNSQAQLLAAIPMGTRGFADNFPCFIVIVGTHSAFPFPRDRHVPYIDSSLAAMGFQFALEVQGLSSCCINWPDMPEQESKLRERIELRDHEFVVMCMAIGFPDPEGMVPYSQKKVLDNIRSYNKGLKC